MGAYGAETKLSMITDKSKPGLVGLQEDQTYPGRNLKPTRMLNTYWLDPAKDDMPVERTEITFVERTAQEDVRFETKYEAYAKTKQGKWYPSQWTVVTTMHSFTKVPKVRRETQRLTIWTDRTLAAEWFKRPDGKMTTQP
jgi:hypothetical protein